MDLNLRQRKLKVLLNDYDVTIQYHPNKASIVADSFSRKPVNLGSLAYLSVTKWPLAKEIQTFVSKFMHFCISKRGGVLASIECKTTFIYEVKSKKF